MNNYHYLKSLKEPKLLIILIVFLLMIIVGILSYFIKTYDTYNTYGVYDNNLFKVDILLDYSDSLKDNRVKIDNCFYSFTVESVSDVLENNGVNYQEYYLKINGLEDVYQNQVKKIIFYYKNERLINKIIRLIF